MSKGNVYRFTRKELKELKINDFKEGDVIICGKYNIFVTYGNFKYASMMTRVNTQDDMRDLSLNKQPQYIRKFIEKR